MSRIIIKTKTWNLHKKIHNSKRKAVFLLSPVYSRKTVKFVTQQFLEKLFKNVLWFMNGLELLVLF